MHARARTNASTCTHARTCTRARAHTEWGCAEREGVASLPLRGRSWGPVGPKKEGVGSKKEGVGAPHSLSRKGLGPRSVSEMALGRILGRGFRAEGWGRRVPPEGTGWGPRSIYRCRSRIRALPLSRPLSHTPTRASSWTRAHRIGTPTGWTVPHTRIIDTGEVERQQRERERERERERIVVVCVYWGVLRTWQERQVVHDAV